MRVQSLQEAEEQSQDNANQMGNNEHPAAIKMHVIMS